ncbi:MAG: hypothetical protein JW784_04825 [Candidatus Cloacimonetes bacterium]|nr:hypothetical protein [Candidatus Cloacimonadota bacterium]
MEELNGLLLEDVDLILENLPEGEEVIIIRETSVEHEQTFTLRIDAELYSDIEDLIYLSRKEHEEFEKEYGPDYDNDLEILEDDDIHHDEYDEEEEDDDDR